MKNGRSSYDDVATTPVTVPYVRYSVRGAHWFLAGALAETLKQSGLAKCDPSCRHLADKRQTRYARDGWNLTGDTFSQDEAGYFHYVARSDDMIISAGYNISPDVEAALLSHPEVKECTVIGAPDEVPSRLTSCSRRAFLDCIDTVKRLQDRVKATIAPFKYPRSVKFVDALPKTQTGKIQRFRLRSSATK